MKKFREFVKQGYGLCAKEMDDFFAGLEPIAIDEMTGEWSVGYLFTKDGTGCSLETLLRVFPLIRVRSKFFFNENYVKAWVYRCFGKRIYILGASAVLRNIKFRGKLSASMIYNYMPFIDHFRKVDESFVMGIMEIRGVTSIYFYLHKGA